MKNIIVKNKHNIKFNLKEVITHNEYAHDKSEYEIPVETDIEKWEVEYFSNGQVIKGIVKTTTLNDVKIENKHNILAFSETGELLTRKREGEEALTNNILGYFEYVRSINTIEDVAFNRFLNFTAKAKNKIYKNIVTLIEKKIDQERFEAYKKSKN
jgi:hypothetical protein